MLKKIKITKLNQYSGHKDCIYSLSLSLNDACFYSGAGEGFVVEWDIENKADGKLICQVNRPVYSLLLLKNKKQLLIGSAQGNLHVIDLNVNKEIKNIEAHTLGIYDIKIHNDTFITTGGDGKINIFNSNNFSLIKSIQASNKSARTIAISHALNHVAIGFSDHSIRIYDAVTFQLIQTLNHHINSVFALSYCSQNKHLLSGGRDVFLKFYDAENNYDLIKDVPAHNLHINAIQFNPKGNLFATVSMDKTLKIWDAETFELLKVIDKARNQAHVTSINKLIWINDTHLLTGSDDKQIMHWQVEME
jgi:WD40 repeat protein